MFKAIANAIPTHLQSLSISGCWSAVSFPGDYLPASLKALHIKDSSIGDVSKSLECTRCQNLESLTVSHDAALQNLKSLTIDDCCSFVFFAREGIVVAGMNCSLPKLQNLTIKHCPKLDLFPIRDLLPNLRSLNITNCVKLLSLVTSKELHPQGLTHLIIGGACDRVKSFPIEGSSLPASLMNLELNGLLSLETLDCKGLATLTSLQQLTIADCPKLENLHGEKATCMLITTLIYYSSSMEKLYRKKDPIILG
ncbi:hypothetical protein AHAS_Ahas04G0057000 [Arachis hypogaea]